VGQLGLQSEIPSDPIRPDLAEMMRLTSYLSLHGTVTEQSSPVARWDTLQNYPQNQVIVDFGWVSGVD